eukprot:IDg21425t1
MYWNPIKVTRSKISAGERANMSMSLTQSTMRWALRVYRKRSTEERRKLRLSIPDVVFSSTQVDGFRSSRDLNKCTTFERFSPVKFSGSAM